MRGRGLISLRPSAFTNNRSLGLCGHARKDAGDCMRTGKGDGVRAGEEGGLKVTRPGSPSRSTCERQRHFSPFHEQSKGKTRGREREKAAASLLQLNSQEGGRGLLGIATDELQPALRPTPHQRLPVPKSALNPAPTLIAGFTSPAVPVAPAGAAFEKGIQSPTPWYFLAWLTTLLWLHCALLGVGHCKLSPKCFMPEQCDCGRAGHVRFPLILLRALRLGTWKASRLSWSSYCSSSLPAWVPCVTGRGW